MNDLDRATVEMLRATSDPLALRRADKADAHGYPAYDRDLDRQPRDLVAFCASNLCGHAFLRLAPQQRFCSGRCRDHAANTRRWRLARERRPIRNQREGEPGLPDAAEWLNRRRMARSAARRGVRDRSNAAGLPGASAGRTTVSPRRD